MTHTTKPISPLRQRMIEDMVLRKLAPKTQSKYLRALIKFTCFLGRSPDTVTLDRPDALAKMSPVREPRKLPVVLSREEVAQLIDAAGKPKYQAVLSAAYGAGLRASEVIALKVGDIDSTRMTLRVEQGKGRKDRYLHRAASQSPARSDFLLRIQDGRPQAQTDSPRD